MLLIKNIGTLATPVGNKPLSGERQGEILTLHDVSILIGNDGRIALVMDGGACPMILTEQEIDAGGRLATPGLIDCHTHLVFGGWRQHELPQKLLGASYLDILQDGGGILSTVRETRGLSEERLLERGRAFLAEMLSLGVTAAEIKSGYGLDLETELRQLRVARRLGSVQPVETVATYLGAHAVPPEFQGRAGDYVDFIVDAVLPAVAREQLAEYCDAFCETGVFSVAEIRRVLEKAASLGLKLRLHADEIDAIGGSELAGELRCTTAEHLIAIGERGLAALETGGVIAALLPATSHYLNKPYAPARRIIERGIPVAVASDFNPGSCPSLNLQFAMHLACFRYRMRPAEVLNAVTLNAACAIGRSGRLGSVEAGKQADLVLWDAPDLDTLCYRFGSNLADTVIKKGQIVKNGGTPWNN